MLSKPYVYGTVMGDWADVICSYGNIARTCGSYNLDKMNVIYFGDQPGVVDFLSEQQYVAQVVQQVPSSPRNHLMAYCMATLRYEVTVADWLSLTDCAISANQITQTHVTVDQHRNPIARRSPMHLPKSVEDQWKHISDDSILVHPYTPGMNPDEEWKSWRHTVMWAWRRFPKIVLSSYCDEMDQLGRRADNVNVCHEPSMLDLFAIANRCRMVITTSDAVAHWVALQGKPAIVVCENGFLGRLYYYNWINVKTNRLLNISTEASFSEMRSLMDSIYNSAAPKKRGTLLTDIKTAEEFNAAIKSGVWMAYFSSPTCGPCRRMSSTITELAEDHNVVKVDISEHIDLATNQNIGLVPTAIFFKDGQEMKRVVGIQSTDKLRTLFDKME